MCKDGLHAFSSACRAGPVPLVGLALVPRVGLAPALAPGLLVPLAPALLAPRVPAVGAEPRRALYLSGCKPRGRPVHMPVPYSNAPEGTKPMLACSGLMHRNGFELLKASAPFIAAQ